MIIKYITLKNFKSFGNNKQTLKFNVSKGDLILISGKNGNGKSSLQQSMDFSTFGIVRGKNSKKVPQNILPNRINKNLETEIEFVNNLSDTVKIQRNLEPTSVKIFINKIDKTKEFKNYSKEDREKVIGFDFETYKSFISMSVSDFANFIDLNPQEKRDIVNKLFNLQDLDRYLSLSKNLIKQKDDQKLKYEIITENNNHTINTLNQNIIIIKKTGTVDTNKELKILNEERLSKKEPFLKLQKEIKEFGEKMSILENKRQDLENSKNLINNNVFELSVELKNIEKQLNVYKSGTCPVCETDLTDETHIHDLSDIESKYKEYGEKLENMENSSDDLMLKITQVINQKNSLFKQKNNSITKFNNLKYDLRTILKKIDKLKEDSKDVPVEELTKNITNLKKSNIENFKKILELDNDIKIYEELREVFSNNGIRRSIIKNIVKPINVYLSDILNELESPYNIKIDEQFNVSIYERLTNEVHPESLSMGESKKINIGIALSYLKLVLKFRKLNVLFLDEVFSSMEPENVEYALNVLKKFTKEFNINIVILDPKVYFTEESDFGFNFFDRVIKIDKKMTFSVINEVK